MDKAERVNKVMLECLFLPEEMEGMPDGKAPDGAVLVDGVVRGYGFHPGRLEAQKEEIRALLNEMPDDFHAEKGGGSSFLNLCMDKHGNHWAEHPIMGALIALGIGVGLAKYCFPRSVWGILPGSVPYVAFDTRSHVDDCACDEKGLDSDCDKPAERAEV